MVKMEVKTGEYVINGMDKEDIAQMAWDAMTVSLQNKTTSVDYMLVCRGKALAWEELYKEVSGRHLWEDDEEYGRMVSRFAECHARKRSDAESYVTIKQFLKSQKEDIDVYDDYDERLGIAYCGEQLTKEGEKAFEDILNARIDNYGHCAVVTGCDARTAQRAKELFDTLSGYCDADEYERFVQ